LRRAIVLDPQYWQYHYDLGRALLKTDAAAADALHSLARACHLASVFVGPRIEPLYRLHASRLKLLIKV
jgi:hypothetical protein